jgi:hypothetical protein
VAVALELELGDVVGVLVRHVDRDGSGVDGLRVLLATAALDRHREPATVAGTAAVTGRFARRPTRRENDCERAEQDDTTHE